MTKRHGTGPQSRNRFEMSRNVNLLTHVLEFQLRNPFAS